MDLNVKAKTIKIIEEKKEKNLHSLGQVNISEGKSLNHFKKLMTWNS